MAYDKFRQSREMGLSAEDRFEKIMKQYSAFKITKSSRNQDMREHWDFEIFDPANEYQGKYDVKAMKKAKRSDDLASPELIYIEFLNVRGDPGWILGKADYIAFEQPEHFICVKRLDLLELARSLTKHEWASSPTLYRMYKRRDRPDELVTMIHLNDLKTIFHFELGEL